MPRMLMKTAHHRDTVKAKPIAQIPDEHTMSPGVSQYLRLSHCWLSQDVLLLQHPPHTATASLRDSWDPIALSN